MAYENETEKQLAQRMVTKLKKRCEKPIDKLPCSANSDVGFEDCCIFCQSARIIWGMYETIAEMRPRVQEAGFFSRAHRNWVGNAS